VLQCVAVCYSVSPVCRLDVNPVYMCFLFSQLAMWEYGNLWIWEHVKCSSRSYSHILTYLIIPYSHISYSHIWIWEHVKCSSRSVRIWEYVTFKWEHDMWEYILVWECILTYRIIKYVFHVFPYSQICEIELRICENMGMCETCMWEYDMWEYVLMYSQICENMFSCILKYVRYSCIHVSIWECVKHICENTICENMFSCILRTHSHISYSHIYVRIPVVT